MMMMTNETLVGGLCVACGIFFWQDETTCFTLCPACDDFEVMDFDDDA